LEVDAHDDLEVGRKFLARRQQAIRVFERGVDVVDRAWADDREQAVIIAAQDAADGVAALGDDDRSRLTEGNLFEQDGRGCQWSNALDTQVARSHGVPSSRWSRRRSGGYCRSY